MRKTTGWPYRPLDLEADVRQRGARVVAQASKRPEHVAQLHVLHLVHAALRLLFVTVVISILSCLAT